MVGCVLALPGWPCCRVVSVRLHKGLPEKRQQPGRSRELGSSGRQGGYGGIGTAEYQLPKLAVARTEKNSVGKEVVVPEMTEAFGIRGIVAPRRALGLVARCGCGRPSAAALLATRQIMAASLGGIPEYVSGSLGCPWGPLSLDS